MKFNGRFGDYGGFYVPEVLIPVLEELEEAFYRLTDYGRSATVAERNGGEV